MIDSRNKTRWPDQIVSLLFCFNALTVTCIITPLLIVYTCICNVTLLLTNSNTTTNIPKPKVATSFSYMLEEYYSCVNLINT